MPISEQWADQQQVDWLVPMSMSVQQKKVDSLEAEPKANIVLNQELVRAWR